MRCISDPLIGLARCQSMGVSGWGPTRIGRAAWLYLAACELAWLMYDLWLAFRETGSFSPRIALGVEQIIRIIAIMLAFIATVAQRRAVK